MKPITLASLKKIAALINAHPGDSAGVPSASLTFGAGNPEAVEQLKALGAHPTANYHPGCYDGPAVIFAASLRVDGVEFRAQWSRKATAEEIATHEPRAALKTPEIYKPAVSLETEKRGGAVPLDIDSEAAIVADSGGCTGCIGGLHHADEAIPADGNDQHDRCPGCACQGRQAS